MYNYMENINALVLKPSIVPVKSVTQKWSGGQEPAVQPCALCWIIL